MNKHTQNLVRSSLFLAVAIVFQFIGRSFPGISQLFVGPAVNAVLIMAAAMSGLWWGVSVGLLTPLLAWMLGQLPTPFGPFIPFIMIANAIFIIAFVLLKDYKKWGNILGIIIGAILKFLLLYIASTKLITIFKLVPPKVASKLVASMGILQLITALIGGGVALLLLKLLKTRKQY